MFVFRNDLSLFKHDMCLFRHDMFLFRHDMFRFINFMFLVGNALGSSGGEHGLVMGCLGPVRVRSLAGRGDREAAMAIRLHSHGVGCVGLGCAVLCCA